MFFLLLVNREQRCLTSKALAAGEWRGTMTRRSKNVKLHLMFILFVFEWQTEQNKIMIKMKKNDRWRKNSYDEDHWPLSKYNFNSVHKFHLLFGHSTQVKEINLLCTPLPTNQHIFFGAYKTSWTIPGNSILFLSLRNLSVGMRWSTNK